MTRAPESGSTRFILISTFPVTAEVFNTGREALAAAHRKGPGVYTIERQVRRDRRWRVDHRNTRSITIDGTLSEVTP